MALRIADVLKISTSGEKVAVKGWVKGIRRMKNLIFIDINDGSSVNKLQVLCSGSSMTKELSFGSSVYASGKLENNPSGQIELAADEIKVLGTCNVTEGFPFYHKKSYSSEYIRQFLHLRSRTSQFCSLMRIRDCVSRTIHNHFQSEGFLNIHTPILTSNDCEGAGEMFLVKPESEELINNMNKKQLTEEEAYFDSKVYLTVSGQLHLEAMARGLGSVYCFGPTFRAENSLSRRHLAEFYMVEAEAVFLDDMNALLSIIEKLVKNVCLSVLDSCSEDMFSFTKENKVCTDFLFRTFIVMTYDEAAEVLTKHSESFSSKFKEGGNLGREHELFLVKYNNGSPVFLINWPKAIKPFYMKEIAEDNTKVYAVDLLVPEVGELCGGSLREDNYSVLSERLKENNLHEKLNWYLELRKFGNISTGGFGMGLERYLQMLLGIQTIKDAIPFPRWPHNCKL